MKTNIMITMTLIHLFICKKNVGKIHRGILEKKVFVSRHDFGRFQLYTVTNTYHADKSLDRLNID